MVVLSLLRGALPPLGRLTWRSRAYGSAAAVQLHHDYDYEDDESELNSNRNRSMEDSDGAVLGRGVQWVIIGDPMAKRHLYAERLSKLLEVPHISMAALVRQELHPHSSLYKQIANAVNQGKLVPEDVIYGLLSKRLEDGYCSGETGFILDGIPRTRAQAEVLDQIVVIDLVVNLKCTEDFSVKKHLGSGIYSHAQEYLSMGSSGLNLILQSRDDKMKCSSIGIGVQKEKLQIHANQMKSLEDYYRKQKKLLEFPVVGAPGETWRGLLAALHLQHLSAVTSSPKLTS
ncbi:unnamed protein product [Ilex paraguariensis]|uniref:adenylate kinase n=1 Tax=Ilex paraguariensis TaxID=185542 RepID=A0ABC8SWY0_9AQUA